MELEGTQPMLESKLCIDCYQSTNISLVQMYLSETAIKKQVGEYWIGKKNLTHFPSILQVFLISN